LAEIASQFEANGADFIIDSIAQLPEILDSIEARMAKV
jgi:phosphoglycolate phosphatase-like HAD superfamily hydrolase